MLILIIEIDGYFNQVLLTGENHSQQELKKFYMRAKELSCGIKNLPNEFCRISGYVEIPYDINMPVEFVIDTDTDRIYSPTY